MNIGIDVHEYTRLKQLLTAAGLLTLAADNIGIVLGGVTFYPNDGSTLIPANAINDGSP